MFSSFGQTVKKDDGNDPWDGIRRNMGTGRVKSCVVTKINYMKKSKQAYVFFSLEIERQENKCHVSNRTPDYSHIKEVVLCGNGLWSYGKGRKFEIPLKNDRSNFIVFLCFVLGKIKDLNSRAPRSLPNIAKYLITRTFPENFRTFVQNAGRYVDLWGTKGDFCFLQLYTVVNQDPDVPQRSGMSHPRLFMMSRATNDYDLSKLIINPKLSQELKGFGRTFVFIEDMEDALISGGGNGLANFLAAKYPGRHIALPPISKDSKVLYLRCEWITPKQLFTPGLLQMEVCKGRPLKTCREETTEEKATTSTASLERVSRAAADTGGWVMQW